MNTTSVSIARLLMRQSVIGVAASIWMTSAYASSCITPQLLNLAGTHTKVLPFGCAFTNDAPFGFTGVAETNGVSENVTINTLEQFASVHGVGGIFISGTIGGAPFGGIGLEQHEGDSLGNLILPVPTTDYPITLTSEIVVPITLPSTFEMRLDPNKVSSGFYSVALGPVIDGVQNYQVTDTFTLYLQLSLDSGTEWVSNDPTFTLSTFDLATSAPEIKAYFGSVPEPPAGVLALGGLASMAWLRIRRNQRRARCA